MLPGSLHRCEILFILFCYLYLLLPILLFRTNCLSHLYCIALYYYCVTRLQNSLDTSIGGILQAIADLIRAGIETSCKTGQLKRYIYPVAKPDNIRANRLCNGAVPLCIRMAHGTFCGVVRIRAARRLRNRKSCASVRNIYICRAACALTVTLGQAPVHVAASWLSR